MKLRILLTLATTALFAGSLFAQPGSIEHAPAGCILEGEMAIMGVETADNGLLRAYFRRQGATDWCYVDGQNRGKASTVTLPKFDPNEQIEYYFVVIDGKRVVAKSPKIYTARSERQCDAQFARHAIMVTLECLPPGTNPISSAMNAGYAVNTVIGKDPAPVQSPERPGQPPKPDQQ
jgi:hypothetical protein